MSKLVAPNNQFKAYEEAPNSRANRVQFMANEESAGEGQQSRIRIPHNRLSYIDTTQSWLHFTPTTTVRGSQLNLARVSINNLGGDSFIRSLRVFVGNRLINEFENYNQICAMMAASNVGVGNTYGNSASAGASQDPRCWHWGTTLKGDEMIISTGTTTANTLAVIDEFAEKGFAINLMGILGSGNPKMLPIGELSSDIEILITWGTAWDGYFQGSQLIVPASGATSPETGVIVQSMTSVFSNVYFNAHVITVSEAVNTEIQKRSRDEDGIMSWSGQLWSLDAKIPLASTDLNSGGDNKKLNNILSGFRYKSLKQILTTGMSPNYKPQVVVDTATTTVSLVDGHRNTPPLLCYGWWNDLGAVRYNIGGRQYPQEAIKHTGEVIAGTNEGFSNHYNGTTNNTFSHFGTFANQRVYKLASGTTSPVTYYSLSERQALSRPFESFPQTVSVVPLEDSEVSGNNGLDTTAIQVVAQNEYNAVTETGYTSFGMDACYCANFDCLYSINKDGLLSVSY